MDVHRPGGTGGSGASLPSLGQVLTHTPLAEEGGHFEVPEAGAGTEGHGGLEEPTNYTGTAVWTETTVHLAGSDPADRERYRSADARADDSHSLRPRDPRLSGATGTATARYQTMPVSVLQQHQSTRPRLGPRPSAHASGH